MGAIIYQDDFIIVREHRGEEIAVQVGRQPAEATPTITNGMELVEAILDHSPDVETIERVNTDGAQT